MMYEPQIKQMNTDRDQPDRSRRSFLALLPFGVLVGVVGSISGAAFRFLRPRLSAPSEQWLDVANVSELSGAQPLAKKVMAEHVSGWAISTTEHNVFVLPAKNNQVLSPICPHEGCEVNWEPSRSRFSCPCHESFFAADGSRISGPAPRGLDSFPTRVQEGKLQVQYRVSDNA
jgi:Rieske Fe-S protein